MQQHILTLGNIQYLIEYRKSTEMTFKHVEEFVMLRQYEINNDVAIDNSIMFIPLSSYKNLILTNEDGSYYQNDNIVFPYKNNDYEGFSTSVFSFSNDTTLKSLKYIEKEDENCENDLKKDYYNLFVKTSDNAFEHHMIECDSIRIYKPHRRSQIDFIISLSNYINNIRFNYFCQRYETQEVKVTKEIKINNEVYHEYIEIFVPNIESLFGTRNVYYNEDLNFFQKKNILKQKSQMINYSESKILLKNLIIPFSIDNANIDDEQFSNINIKTFIVDNIESEDYINTDYNYSNIPFVLTLQQYDTIDEASTHYLSLNGISPSSIVFSEDNQFKIKARLGFDINNRNIISIINEWNYPTIYNSNGNILNLKESYFYFNKITDIKSYEDFDGYDDDTFLGNFSDEMLESLTFNNNGCVVEMAIDIRFKHVFYRRSAGMNSIDDYSFNLDNIFFSWKDYPEVIFIRTMFIDKFLSKIFFSNILTLTKEKFKYCINDTSNNFRINLKDMETFNFVDKINCIINRHDIMKENVIINGKSSNSNIIYKTVFYKTHESQNIKIRKTVVQNIGINLGEYLSKVEDFKMIIEGYEFVECARNDVFVIFKIPGAYFTNASGKYDIVDASEDTYITSGDYELC